MKVIWIVSNFPDGTNSFAGVFYKRMVDGIFDLGVEVYVIAPKPARNISDLWKLIRVTTEKSNSGYITIYRPYYLPIPFGLFLNLKLKLIEAIVYRCLKGIKIDFDLVHSFYAFPWGNVGIFISKKFNIPSVVTFVGDDINFDIYISRFIKRSVSEIVRYSKVITVSNEIKSIVEKNFTLRDNISVIYDGLDFNSFPTTQKTNPNNSIILGFVGELTSRKGCDVLLELIVQFGQNVQWRIVGEGPYFARLSKFTNVFMLGKIAPVDVLRFYQSLSIFVFPSKSEGIPNVLKEAAFYSVPIVASRLPGIVELTDGGDLANLVSDFNSASSFTKSIKDTLSRMDYEKKRAERLKVFVIKNFSIRNSSERLIGEYNSIFYNQA
jgi:glycosyltransferase involved in cell wall biosynthesis